ncbi:transcription factor TFIIIB component B'' homolog isoform X1 [Carlito syrichta]|uniref:Transcription factor TFIIIB component B'' homolog isoform X1 n=1 Tax=Carlito syrichta TaxID=1868482 RepID=A0A1U7U1F4_CARSF|nr:transcription factor TFIIIB component B'' homolog isoform X1 [Carlito syrichta]
MFRRARLSVKPNVRPGVGARGSAAPNPQRGRESPRPPEPAADSASEPAEPTDVPAVDFRGAGPQEKASRGSDEKTGHENDVEESSKSSSTVSQRRKRISSTSSLVKPRVSVPSEPHPSSSVNQEALQPNSIPGREKQPCSDRYRIYKAQKLREMLREELRKEKKQWKNKYAINESQRPPDRSKMTMRDFIYYLPDNNPMTSSLEQEKRTEKPLTSVQTREQESKSTPDAEDNEEMEEERDDGPLLVPRVKVAEDGSIILDEESLTVEVLRTKGPCVVEENDPIFERGSTTTYSSFRKNYYSKPWSNKETDMFFLAISMVGTDFSMIGQLFPHRARIEIKNKFKREEKTNGWRIDKAFQEKRPFDFDFFAHLLQKVLAEEEKRKQKSVKNQSLKEKKSSKPQKSLKVKKIACEGVNDDPDESVSSRISDTEISQKDAQTVEEEESLTLSGQDSEQVVLEQGLNQNKRRSKNQDEANQQEVNGVLGNATVHLGPSKGEKHKNKCQPISTEVNEDECSKEQKLSCVQNIGDIVVVTNNEKSEKRTDPILSSSKQRDAMPVSIESSESSTPDLPSLEVGSRALCEENNAKSSCTEERNVDLKKKSLETDQTENIKPILRGRFRKPKPNLSRAVGKKSVLSQGRTEDGESKNSCSETSVEKNHMEEDKTNTLDIYGMENAELENPETETISNLSEKMCLRENNRPQPFRPARVMRGRLQRPKPNGGEAERTEVLIPEKNAEVNVEESESESCVGRDTFQQMDDQSCKNFEHEDVTSQHEKKDALQNVQLDEPKALNESLSIHKDKKANICNQVPILRTRFQKPKPNIGRRTVRKEISSKEELPEKVVASGEMTTSLEEIVRLDTSPRETVSVEFNMTKEIESNFKETGEREISPKEKVLEALDFTLEMVTGLKATGREMSPREKTTEMISTEAVDSALEETGREISPQENDPEESKPVGEMGTGLKETGREMPVREKIPEMIDVTEEREEDLEETERREITALVVVSEEAKTMGEIETDFKELAGEISQREKVPVEVSAIVEREIDLKETGKIDVSLMDNISGKMTCIEEMEADFKETGREVSLRGGQFEEICITEETVADLKTGKLDISLRENEPEVTSTSGQTETDLMQSGSGDCRAPSSLDIKNFSSEVQSMMHTSVEEKRNSKQELSRHLNHFKTSSQTYEFGKTEDHGMPPPDVPEQFSDISKSLPQEQKPLEIKSAPFVRSRFKRPKPNLTRAALKRETTDTAKHLSGKKSETDKMEPIVIQPNSEQADTLPSQHGDASLMTSREKDKSGSKNQEAALLPCIQTEKVLSPSDSCEPKGESPLSQVQENDLVVSTGTRNINTLQQEMKESVTQTARPIRGRLQRPRPNVRKAGQRPTVEKGEAKAIIKEEKTVFQKDETKKKVLTMPNSQIGTEIEVASSKVSECRIYENQHQVVVENLYVNKTHVLDEKMRHENKPCVPSPAQLIRRKFQKAKPNLGRAHGKKGYQAIEKGTAMQSKASKPEDNLLQQGSPDTQLLPKEKSELMTSLEVLSTRDCVDSKESGLAKKNAELEEVGPSGRVGEEAVGDNSMSLIAEEQDLSKLASSPQLLKEPNHSKAAPDRRTTLFSASECEIDHSERRIHRKIKPSVTKGRGSKRIRGKTSKKEPRASKAMLVTLRASQEEEEDDAEDFESDYEEENYHLAPEEVNKAPVFVPVGLRSPEPVSAQIEETMEELEITVNVPDVGCIAVVEHQFPNTDVVTTQEVKQEESLHASLFEMATDEHTQNEPGTNDGSTEAAITLLTMGDLVLQSEISTEQGDVGVCVLPHVHSEDKSHIPFSPDNVNHKIVHEYQELSSPVIGMFSASFEENKIVLEEQSIREEVTLMESIEENSSLARNTASRVTSNLRMRNRFSKPKPNLRKILGTNRFHDHQEVPSLCVTKGEELETQRETEKNASKATELEDKNLGPVTTAESKEQTSLACVHGIKGTSVSQEVNLTKRNEHQEEGSEEIHILSVAPIASSETGPRTPGLGRGLGESSVEEPQPKNSEGDSMLALHVPECIPTGSIPEIQQENGIIPQDPAAVNVPQDGEEEQAFILTLVEIPTSAVEEFTDANEQLIPNPLLPAPILVKSMNNEERNDMSICLPVTSGGQDAMCLSNSGRADSEKPPDNWDFIPRKRLYCRLDENNRVPSAKKRSLTLRDDCQECASEVYSKELINVFDGTGESYKGQDVFPTSGNTHTTPAPQKEQVESVFQNIGSRSLDTPVENNMPQLPQDAMTVSEQEERTDAAPKSEQMSSRTSSSKTPLSRPGRRPLGFLSLICSKSSLESDEPAQVHSKKRLKPLIPASRQKSKRSNPVNESQKKNRESSDLPASPSVINTQSENTGSSAAQISHDRPLLKKGCKSGQNRAPEEEAASVSEYFFNDIFIEVDETA